MISIFDRDNITVLNVSNFPDGETITRYFDIAQPLNILWQYENDAELMALAQFYALLKSIDKRDRFPKNLYIPYLPHARQDRAATNDTCSAVGVFVNMLDNIIKNTNTKVYTLDIHSDATIDIFDRYVSFKHQSNDFLYENIDSCYFAKLVPQDYDAIICPDNGAIRRSRLWWDKLIVPNKTTDDLNDGILPTKSQWPSLNPNHKTFINCSKNRDPQTGKLSNPSIDNPLHLEYLRACKKVLIVDDIGTGFGTHIQLGEVLKSHNPELKLDLFVSHSSFTRGLKPVLDVFNMVYTTDSLPQGNRNCTPVVYNHRVVRFNCLNCLPEII